MTPNDSVAATRAARSDSASATRSRPNAAITELVQATWAETLRLRRVGPDDDFFALGGHSRMAATAVARLSQLLGFELPPRALFQAPTPAEMAELIAALRRGSVQGTTPFAPDWVVPLQREGAGRPVFVFPAAHSEVHALAGEARVAALVGRDRPFWGLRQEHPDLEQARAGGVPGLAAAYVAQMRTIQAEGPYLLYATCGGGYFAWEVAGQLLAMGERVAGILFYEVTLRTDFAEPVPGQTPANVSLPWRLSETYRPEALAVDLTFLMSDLWRGTTWWTPWRQVTLGRFEPIVLAEDADFAARRDEIIAAQLRAWIERAETRLRTV